MLSARSARYIPKEVSRRAQKHILHWAIIFRRSEGHSKRQSWSRHAKVKGGRRLISGQSLDGESLISSFLPT